MEELSEAITSKIKNKGPNNSPKNILLKVSDNVIKTRPTPPLFTSKPDAKIMGKIS